MGRQRKGSGLDGVRIAATMLVCAAGMVLSSCTSMVGAVVRCADGSAYHAQLGTLNLGHLPLGAVLVANTDSRQVYFLGSVRPTATELVTDPPRDETVDLSSSVEVTITGSVSPSDAATIKARVAGRTVLAAQKLGYDRIAGMDGLINADDVVRGSIRRAITGPSLIVLGVSGIGHLDHLTLTLTSTAGTEVSGSALKVGKFSVNVTYQCSDIVTMSGTGTGGLMKVTPYRYDPAKDRVSLDSSTVIDMSTFKIINAL